jgi:hypothetical protein
LEKKIRDLTVNEFQALVHQTMHETFEDVAEEILALSSPEYLKSIEEARKDFKEGKTKTFEEVFNV